jgi:hypothetical protein
MPKRRRWQWILFGVFIGCPCLLMGIVLTAFRTTMSSAGSRLPEEIEAARKAGLPTEIAELRQMAAVPDKDNAANLYQRAIGFAAQAKRSVPRSFDKSRAHILGGIASPSEGAEMRAELPKYDACLQTARQASGMPGVDWHRQWEQGYMMLLPECSELSGIAQLFCARATLRSKSGQTDEALQDIGTALHIARHVGEEPILISFLVQVKIEATAFATLERVLNSGPATGPLLGEAAGIVAGLDTLPNPRWAAEGELILSRQVIHTFRSVQDVMGPGSDDTFLLDWLAHDPNYRRAWEAKAVHYMRLCIAAIPERQPTWRQVHDAFVKLDTDVEADGSLENRLNQLTLPVYANTGDSYGRALANRRLMATGIAILSLRQSTHRLPDAMPDLGDSSTDPFTLKPLKYKRMGGGFKVYSVDADGIDDGGLTLREDKRGKSKTHDLARTFK